MYRVLSVRSLLALGFLTALVCGWPSPAHAQLPADAKFSYDLSVVGTGGGETPVSGSLFYTPGQPLTVRVYLRQSAGTTEVIARDNGLVGGGVRLTYGATSGTAGVINVAVPTDIAINTGDTTTQFNDAASSNATRQVNADFAQFIASTDFTRGAVPGTDGRVLLGAVTFQTPGGGNGTTTLTLDDIPPSTFDDVITFAGFNANPSYILDSRVDPLTVTVAPVPEPGMILTAAAAGLGLTGLIRRRRSIKRAG